MEKQQVQMTRLHFVDEIPEEVERLFRKSASSLSHYMGEPLIELTNLLEQRNYIVFLEKLQQFRERLARADLLLEDCKGIVRNYINITTQPQQPQQPQQSRQPQPAHTHPPEADVDFTEMINNMQAQAKKAQDLKTKLENPNVQEG